MSDWNDQFAMKGEDGVYRSRRVAVATSDDADPSDNCPEQPGIDDDYSCCRDAIPEDLLKYRALEDRQAHLVYDIVAQKHHAAFIRSAGITGLLLAEANGELRRLKRELRETERHMEMLLN